jgi:predicted transcriptional regulator
MRLRKQSGKEIQLPTAAELEILNILWAAEQGTVREVHDALNSGKNGKGTGYTTVLKQMQVMAAKGLLKRSERFRSHVYEACVAREQTQQRLTRNLLQQVFNGSTKNLVLGALSSQKVSWAEMAEIRQMLDKYEKESR